MAVRLNSARTFSSLRIRNAAWPIHGLDASSARRLQVAILGAGSPLAVAMRQDLRDDAYYLVSTEEAGAGSAELAMAYFRAGFLPPAELADHLLDAEPDECGGVLNAAMEESLRQAYEVYARRYSRFAERGSVSTAV